MRWRKRKQKQVDSFCARFYNGVAMKKKPKPKPKQRSGRPYALPDSNLPDIMILLEQGTSVKAVSEQYGVTRVAVHSLLARHGHKHVTTVTRKVVSKC